MVSNKHDQRMQAKIYPEECKKFFKGKLLQYINHLISRHLSTIKDNILLIREKH